MKNFNCNHSSNLYNAEHMRGKIIELNESYGYIQPFYRKEKLLFNANAIIGVSWKNLRVETIVDFIGTLDKASYVRKSYLQWFEGEIESITTTSWGDTQWNIKTKVGNRRFWFFRKNILLVDIEQKFNVGDKVKFQCEGYNESRNQAYNVTTQQIGYITSYDFKTETGIIDYSISFNKKDISNYEQYCIDSSKYFYLISYSINDGLPRQIVILDEVDEIIFDKFTSYIDGYVEKIGTSRSGKEYLIISDSNGSSCKFKTTFQNFDSACKRKWLERNHHVSYMVSNKGEATEIAWTGYITRFPINPVTNDMSARINDKIWRNEVEDLKPELIYFRKNNIANVKYDKNQKKFWLDTYLLNKFIQIPIKTYQTFQRYKVRYVLTDDEVYGKKAIKITIIGVAKSPIVDVVNQETINLPSNNVVVNNFYAPVYQQVNFIQNVLQFDGETFKNYLQNHFNKCIKSYINTVEYDDSVSYAIDTCLLPSDSTVEDKQTFDEQFNTAVRVLSKKYNLQMSEATIQWLSEKCQLYLKSAIIIDYKLMGEKCILADLSAQSVFYGKFLEQLLKDVLYPWFKGNDTLSNTLTRVTHTGKKEVTLVGQTTIGTYYNAINLNIEIISEICSKEFLGKTKQEWVGYWKELRCQLEDAKRVRNDTDHAGALIGEDDVDKIRVLIFAQTGILDKIETIYNYMKDTIENMMFIYKYPLYGKNEKIQGLIGVVSNKSAILHISKLDTKYVSQNEINRFIDVVRNKPFSVKAVKDTGKRIEVTLVGVTPDFKMLMDSNSCGTCGGKRIF